MLPSRQTVTKYAAVGTSQCGRFLRRIISPFDMAASGACRFRHVENVPPQPCNSWGHVSNVPAPGTLKTCRHNLPGPILSPQLTAFVTSALIRIITAVFAAHSFLGLSLGHGALRAVF